MPESLQERRPAYFTASVLVLLFAVALSLRLYCIEGTLFYSDQAFCWRVASSETVGELLDCAAGDTHPPGYFLVLRCWMKIAGTSPIAIRGFSVILGIMSIVVFYGLFREVMDWADSSSQQCGGQQVGALFAVVILSVHYVPVEASRLARMYVLGTLLAAASSWLLLRAIRSEKSSWRWWVGYGLAVAAFCYTHSYSFFTIGAHTVFVSAIILGRLVHSSRQQAFKLFTGFMGAATLAFLLYLPWLPRFLGQLHRVQTDFWISPITTGRLEEILLSWATGIGYWDGMGYSPKMGIEHSNVPMMALSILVFLEVLTVWFVIRRDRAGLFFLALAAVPWALGLGASWLGDRPILLPRYLTFAHIGLVGMVSVAFARLRIPWARALLGAAVILPCLYGTWLHMRLMPKGPPAICEAVIYLEKHYQEHDSVITSRPKRLLELKYHADQLGLRNIDLRCPVRVRTDGGHENLFSAISVGEYLWPEGTPPISVQRIWIMGTGDGQQVPGWYSTPAGWRLVTTKSYQADDDWEEPSYTLILYERDNAKDE